MDNKKTGYLLLGVAIIIIAIIYIFNSALHDIVTASCSVAGHGDECPMYNTIDTQTNFSLAIVALVIIVALFLIFATPEKEVIIKTREIEKPKKEHSLKDLKPEEKEVFLLIEKNKTIFQADLIEKTELGKAKMTRILDKLEGKGLVERKRRGMTNVVVLSQ